jgi:hypothetical protein
LQKSPVIVLSNSGGNYFYEDVRGLIVAGMEAAGLNVVGADETFHEFSPGQVYFIIAPQEFFYLGQGITWRDKPIFDRTLLLTTDHVHDTWFSLAFPFVCQSPLIFDIDYAHARLLQSLGRSAYYLPLGYLREFAQFDASGYLPELEALEGLPPDCREHPGHIYELLSNRPLDLSFIGGLTPRREKFFASLADFWSEYRCYFYLSRYSSGVKIKGKTAELNAAAFMGIARRTKISLNIHRSEVPYFEWFRIVFQGLWQKTLVLTEPTWGVPGLKPGRDYLTAELQNFPAIIRWLLESETGRNFAQEVAASGHENLIKNCQLPEIFSWIASG